MRIKRLEVAAFGPLRDLDLTFRDEHLTVVHGLNGSGKTTLLRFLRGMLKGEAEFSQNPDDPDFGITPEGSVVAEGGSGVRVLTRRTGSDGVSRVDVTDQHGRPVAGGLSASLERVTAAQFRQCFAAGRPQAHQFDELLSAAESFGVAWHERIPDEVSRLAAELDDARRHRAVREPEIARDATHAEDQLRSERLELSRWEEWEAKRRELTSQRERLARIEAELRTSEQNESDRLARLEEELRDLHRRPILTSDQLDRLMTRLAGARDELRRLDDELARARGVQSDIEHHHGTDAGYERRFSAEQIADLERRLRHARRRIEDAERGREYLTTSELDSLRDEARDLSRELAEERRLAGRHPSYRDEQPAVASRVPAARRGITEWIAWLSAEQARIERELSREGEWDLFSLWRAEHRGEELPRRVDHWLDDEQRLRAIERDHTRLDLRTRQPWWSQIERLEAECTRVRTELDRLTQRRRETEAQLVAVDHRLAEYATDRDAYLIRQEIERLTRLLADLRSERERLAETERRIARDLEAAKNRIRPGALSEAGRLFRTLSGGEYDGLVWDSHYGELHAARGSRRTSVSDLSRGTADLVGLALRLAAWSGAKDAGLRLPLILDDVLTDVDLTRGEAAVRVMREAAEKNGQLIYLTCQQHLIDGFERGRTSIVRLPRPSAAVAGPVRSGSNGRSSTPLGLRSRGTTENRTRSESASLTISTRVEPTTSIEETLVDTDWAAEPVSRLELLTGEELDWCAEWEVRTVGDFAALDGDDLDQMTEDEALLARLRARRNEAIWLCDVPTLSSEDARYLSTLGYRASDLNGDADEERFFDSVRRAASEHQTDRVRNWGRRLSRSRSSQWSRSRRRWRESGRSRSYSRSERRSRSERDSSRSSSTRTTTTRSTTTRSTSGVSSSSASQTERSPRPLRFFLNLDSPIVEAPSVGPKTASRLKKLKVRTVQDLLALDPEEAADTLNVRHIPAASIRDWQSQAILMCQVPEMRCHDVQILVACEIRTPEELAISESHELLRRVTPFCESQAGERIIRSSKAPDLAEVTDWIRYANASRSLADAA